jgi:hypothetical protein
MARNTKKEDMGGQLAEEWEKKEERVNERMDSDGGVARDANGDIN